MVTQDVIEISSGESDEEKYFERREILEPVVGRVVAALGGYEGETYVLGDEANGCLKDLKKLWRKDDTDDERTVARLFWEMHVLPNDLVPIILETAGKGLVEDKRAISCVDLLTAMTWPIDMAEELKELDDELDKGTDYTQLLQSHLYYKLALLKPGVIQALFGIMLPPLAKPVKERVQRDGQIVNVVLHLFRNLAFIKDLPANSHLSSDHLEFSNLQSKLIKAFSETHTFDLLLTIAANADNDPLFNGWNTLVLEIIYLLFRGVKPNSLAADQIKQPAENLQRLLALEDRTRLDLARKANSRHSRFGTTISVKLNPDKRPLPTENNAADSQPAASTSRSLVLHRQQAIHGEAGSILDITKRQKSKKVNKVDDVGVQANLSLDAKLILQNLASNFVEACYNPFLSALLKDIRSERPKISEKDNLRLLYVTKWFLEYFLAMRSREQQTKTGEGKWNFDVIAEVTERWWIIWVLKRMRQAVDEKPKLWNELQAGIECLTQLLLLIDNMASSEIADPTLKEAADILQQQLVYDGEVLDISLESLRSYTPGTQSLAYLDSSVYLAYALLRMLEKWGKEKGNETYVRQKASRKKRQRKGVSEEEGIPDVEEEVEEDDVIQETLFTFEAFEGKFAQADITHTLLIYLARYREFSSSENMRRVVSLLHRQAVKVKAEGLFFKVSTLDLFKTILADQKSLPGEQPYKDLINLINFILRQFFKALEKNSFLAVEAFFPKNRGHWKQYSSWEPEEKSKRRNGTTDDTRLFPPDVEVKKGYSWSDQLGIAIASLVEANQEELVKWAVEILTLVIGLRMRIIEETDKRDDAQDSDVETSTIMPSKEPSAEALAKITDYLIPYTNEERANAATKNPKLKLLFRLSKFYILDQDADELEWYIPSGIGIDEMDRTIKVINQFLEHPIDLGGQKASSLLSRKRRRRRRSPSPDPDDDAQLSGDEPRRKKRKEKKKKEKEQYKSAQFIEDSDEEYGNMDAFLQKEEERRKKAEVAAQEAGKERPTNMKSTGTKKRRKQGLGKGSKSKKRRGDGSSPAPSNVDHYLSDAEPGMSGDSDVEVLEHVDSRPTEASGTEVQDDPVSSAPRPRPRPRPVPKHRASAISDSSPLHSPGNNNPPSSPSPGPMDIETEPGLTATHGHRKKLLILSDEE